MCTSGKIMIALSAGVDYLHTADMIHGDLKSANVLLKSTGTDARGFTCKVSPRSHSALSTACTEDLHVDSLVCGAGLTHGSASMGSMHMQEKAISAADHHIQQRGHHPGF